MPDFCNDQSVMDRTWKLCVDPECGVPLCVIGGRPVPREVAMIAARRGAHDIAAFLQPTLRAFMPDPHVLHSMEAAASRFAAAVEARETVAVFGDYDVDGATSTSMLLRYQRLVGLDGTLFHIPQRLTEGYGPNIPAFEGLRDKGATLLVVADSGTGAIRQIARAREIGMDVIVIDHHEPNEDGGVPNAIVVNPKLPPNDGAHSYLCTAGLAFLFLIAVNRRLRLDGFFVRTGRTEPKLQSLLGLVALGTVADCVPLVGLNRAYVALGLAQMPLVPGVVALNEVVNEDRRRRAEESGRKHEDLGYTAYGCGFVYGPCINAGGRISDTRQGTWLLSTDDPVEAHALAVELNRLNRARQRIQEEMVDDCCSRVADPGPDDSVLVVHDEAWHPGVIGLGATKLKDRFDRSAVVIGTGGKGSARSVDGFNLGKSFLKAVEEGLLLKGGGHAAAAGLTIDPARIDEFRAFMNARSLGTVRPPTKVDLVVRVGELGVEAVDAFELLAPFGMGNAKPRVAFTGGVLMDVRVLGEKHVKARLVLPGGRAAMGVIQFNCVGTPLGTALIEAEGHRVDVLGEADVNEYKGVRSVQVKPSDIMVGEPITDLARTRLQDAAEERPASAAVMAEAA